jgi:hypothetical protein
VSLYDRAKHRIACFLLSPNVHLLAILLINECKGDVGGVVDGAGGREDPFSFVTEDDVTDVNFLGLAWIGDGAVFAGPHGKEESQDSKCCADCGCGVASGRCPGPAEAVKYTKELWSYCFLTIRGWVKVVECV